MTTSECRTPSQPESLDLDYDNWQGQFEIVGPKLMENCDNKSKLSLINHNGNGCLEDLEFNLPTRIKFNINNNNLNQSSLVAEETFLNLHPSDFFQMEDDYDGLHSQSSSLSRISTHSSIAEPYSSLFVTDNKEEYLKIEDLHNNLNKRPTSSKNEITNEFCETLTEQLELLQKQVTNLADSQNIVEDRTTRTKTEYAVLQARYHMLEEQLRESELRSDGRLAEEQKRHRELLARVEREAQLQNENYQIRIKTLELESNSLKDEIQRIRIHCDKQAVDLHSAEEKYDITRDNLTTLQEELVELRSKEEKLLNGKNQLEDLMIELSKEIERTRAENGPALPTTSAEALRLEELHNELEELRLKNKNLEGIIDELQAIVLTKGLEEGRNLLNGTSNSLAQELEEMSQTQDIEESAALASLSQLQTAYHEKEEENLRLKHYIDTILLNIVENYPQLLEVKPANMSIPHSSSSKAKP